MLILKQTENFAQKCFSSSTANQATWMIVLLGILLRAIVWLQARSVYLDEVNLLRNFLERSYAELFKKLDYYQYSPPLFSVIMKLTISIFGNSELSIRLIPLVAGCCALVLFANLSLKLLPTWWAAIGTSIIAFSEIYLDYTTICKQYSTDFFVSIGLITLCNIQLRQNRFKLGSALGWTCVGTVSIWISMPAVFVLAGIGLALIWKYKQDLQKHTAIFLLIIGVMWVISFLLYFKLLLQIDAQSKYLQNYHQDAFLVILPLTSNEWHILGLQLGGLADKGFGKTALAMIIASVGLIAGCLHLGKSATPMTWLILTPLLTCLGASAMHFYSLQPRLMLFWLPIALLVVLIGLSRLGQLIQGTNKILIILTIIVLTNQQRLRYFVTPLQSDYADVKGEFYYINAQQKPEDSSFIYFNEEAPAYYYLRLYPKPIKLNFSLVETPDSHPDNSLIKKDVLSFIQAGHQRVWLTYDRPDFWLRDWAAQQGRITQFKEFHKGYAFLLTTD